MKFSYISVTQTGERKKGVKEASDKFALARDLKSENETLISVEEKKALKFFNLNFSFIGGVKMHEKIIFARNLASMLEAGLPLSRCLSVMERQTKNKTLKQIIVTLNEDVKKGKTLSQGMKGFPKIFSSIFTSMVAAGEESGKLAESLGVIASQMEKTYALQKKIKGAMIYPSIIVFAMLGIGIFMLMFIVPTLAATFKELGSDLPASTKFIISVSDTFQSHMILFIGGLLLIVLIIISAVKTAAGKRLLDTVVLYIPVISPLVKEANSARTARTLSSLLSAGVSVVEALNITREVLQNHHYKDVIEDARRNVEVGSPMSEVFSKAEKFYPVFVGEMISVGEETGDLGGTLLKVAIFYETEVEQKTKDMSTIIEPVLMLIVGVAVGFFAVSMISPIYSVVDKI